MDQNSIFMGFYISFMELHDSFMDLQNSIMELPGGWVGLGGVGGGGVFSNYL